MRRTEEKVSVFLDPSSLLKISCTSEQSKDNQEVLSLILHCKTMHCCRMTSPSTSTTSGTLTTSTLSSRVDWFQEEEVSKGTGSQCFSMPVNQMYASQDVEEVQYDLDTPGITVYKNTWRVHQKYSILVQFEARSGKRIAVLSNPIAHNRSFQHFTCDFD